MSSEASSGDQGLVQWLLAEARKQPTPPPTAEEAEAPEYDWHRPSRYQAQHLDRLGRFARDCAAEVARALSGLIRAEIKLELKEVAQAFAWQIRQEAEGTDSVFVRLLDASGAMQGLTVFPVAAAVNWVDRLLGGASGSDERELSPLEVDLLVDAVGAVAKAMSDALVAAGGQGVTAEQEIRRGPVEIEGEDVDEYSRLVLVNPKQPDEPDEADEADEPQMVLLLRCEQLDPVVGIQPEAQSGASLRANREMLLGHLAPALVGPVEVRLGASRLTLRDVMALEPGDVVVLDHGADDPVDVLLQGRLLLHAHPVQCAGQYAAQILAWADPTGEQPG